MKQIKIGTLIGSENADRLISEMTDYGFECYSLTHWKTTGNLDMAEHGKRIKELADTKGVTISSLSIFSNPLMTDIDAIEGIKSWEKAIDHAHLFGTDLVTGFTGRIVDRPIDESMGRFKEVFGELAKRAEAKGVRIAFENCDMHGTWKSGDWNIAHNPLAWAMMFEQLPLENLGLQWEPCHQMVSLIDPIPQLKKWVHKIFNVHGKDATIDWDVIKKHGIHGPKEFVWHRTPGFGDSNWTDIISILRQGGYGGSIDIEGYHDPVYRGEWEMTGQVHALNYLKQCRGGDFIKNPTDWKND